MRLLSLFPTSRQTPLYLLKFSSNKHHLLSLQQGTIYMNMLQYFIDLEHSSGHKGMGDLLEATTVISDLTNVRMISEETGQVIPIGDVRFASIRFDELVRLPVFCLAALTSSTFEVLEETDTEITVRPMFTTEQRERFSADFGSHVLIIRANDFRERIENRLQQDGLTGLCSLVKYDDFGMNTRERLQSCIEEPLNAVFWKDNSLAYQMEYRLVLLNPDLEVPFTYSVGDMSSFTYLMSTDELFGDSMRVTISKI